MTLSLQVQNPVGDAADKSATVELPAEIFDAKTNVALIHQVVVAQLAAARQGTHKTKTRGEVSGGGVKPYRQKGTGRARQGSIRAPQFTGGGTVHGPQPRSYDQRTPKKMKAAALRGALSDRARNDRVFVVSSLVEGDVPSTKAAAAALARISGAKHVLVVATRADELTWKSLRNLPTVHLLEPGQLNTYDVLVSDDVVFTQGALEQFLAGPIATRVGRGALARQRPSRGSAGSSEFADEPVVPSMLESEAADTVVAGTDTPGNGTEAGIDTPGNAEVADLSSSDEPDAAAAAADKDES